MRPEFNYIREYNSQIIDLVIAGYECNKSLKESLRELDQYTTARPVEGLGSCCPQPINQVIIDKINELQEEVSRLKRYLSYLKKRQSMSKFLVELHTASY